MEWVMRQKEEYVDKEMGPIQVTGKKQTKKKDWGTLVSRINVENAG
jgi:hypothetical protein